MVTTVLHASSTHWPFGGGPVAGAACQGRCGSSKAENGYTALHIAAEKGHLAMVQWLVQDAQADVAAEG